jgi:hypothetical protein
MALPLGLVVILMGLSIERVPRPRFLGSEPPAGARLETVPRAVRVWFKAPIDANSTLTVQKCSGIPKSFGVPIGSPVAASRGPDPGNPVATSLRATLPDDAPRGFYLVSWKTYDEKGRRFAYGSLVFSAGIEPGTHPFDEVIESTYWRRSGWPAVGAGVVMMLVPLLTMWLRRRPPPGSDGDDVDDDKGAPDAASKAPPGTWGEPPTV